MNQENQRPIILASASPRRRELLAGLGLNFEIHPSDVDEEVPGVTSPADLVEALALKKAKHVADLYQQGIIIGSDTVVVVENQILGKPKSEAEAFAMLRKLQGRFHTVYTGLALIDVTTSKKRIGHQFTQVTMRKLTDVEIYEYIATKEPMDKAGAYAIQGIGAILIEQISGDYYAVVGLPLQLTAQFLQQFGVNVLHKNQPDHSTN